MSVYTYNQLKEIAKRVKERLAQKGIILEKTSRRKPRDSEKLKILFQMASARIQKFRPLKRNGKIVLPYFLREGTGDEGKNPAFMEWR